MDGTGDYSVTLYKVVAQQPGSLDSMEGFFGLAPEVIPRLDHLDLQTALDIQRWASEYGGCKGISLSRRKSYWVCHRKQISGLERWHICHFTSMRIMSVESVVLLTPLTRPIAIRRLVVWHIEMHK